MFQEGSKKNAVFKKNIVDNQKNKYFLKIREKARVANLEDLNEEGFSMLLDSNYFQQQELVSVLLKNIKISSAKIGTDKMREVLCRLTNKDYKIILFQQWINGKMFYHQKHLQLFYDISMDQNEDRMHQLERRIKLFIVEQ